VLHRAARNFVLLNLYPYTAGHMMIVPYEHVGDLESAAAETTAEMMLLTREASRALNEVYHPQGINLGMNLGRAAGAGIASHIHMHILPRWNGDANFLTTIGETRMLPEELPATWLKLKAKFDELT
jgi:ATP adenylyltransferase